MTETDVVVIGGGIAGVSAAHYLASSRRVILVEAEPQLAYHTTGRSAALLFESYGHPAIRPLTRASRGFLTDPPAGLAGAPLLTPRGALTLALAGQSARLAETAEAGREAGADVRLLTTDEAVELVPALRPDLVEGAVWEPGAADMDVGAIHQAFVRGMRAAGGEIRRSSRVTALSRHNGRWRIAAGDDTISADVVVNAAGAWCDLVATSAGVRPVGLVPKRRTAFMVPGDESFRDWPLVVDTHHTFYFKPDGTQLLCSPADETPSAPGDARHEEVDVALAIERINAVTTLDIRVVRSAWAGLRSFVPDQAMVIGFDAEAEGFFWLAGQGGTGIQTAPGAGRLAAALITGGPVPGDLVEMGVDLAALSPARLR